MKTTKLEAVNRMLAGIGEAPVLSVDAQLPEVQQAITLLNQVTREILSQGWNFNSDESFPVNPSSDGSVSVPGGALRVDATNTLEDIVERNGKFYNRNTHSFTFDKPLSIDIVWLFDFETLPFPVSHYIGVRAARRFQREMLGSSTMDKMTDEDEQRALVSLIEYETSTSDINLLTGNPENLEATWRY